MVHVKLKAIGIDITEKDICDTLIFNLAPAYNTIATTLMQSAFALTVASFTSTLVDVKAKVAPEATMFAQTYKTV